MKTDIVNLDQQMFKILYEHYRSYIIPLVTIIVCVLVGWLFIVPQIKAYQVLQVQIKEEKQKVDALSKNYDILSSIDGDALTDKMNIIAEALPDSKDFVGILRSFSVAASVSGVTLGDYALTVGDVSSKIPHSATDLSLSVAVVVEGELSKIESFIATLQKQFPLSNVSKVSLS